MGVAVSTATDVAKFAVAIVVFSNQAFFYVAPEREHIWSSRPGK